MWGLNDLLDVKTKTISTIGNLTNYKKYSFEFSLYLGTQVSQLLTFGAKYKSLAVGKKNFFFFFFLGLHLKRDLEIPRLGVESEL